MKIVFHQISGSESQIPGSMHQISSTKHQIPGSEPQR